MTLKPWLTIQQGDGLEAHASSFEYLEARAQSLDEAIKKVL
jgi:hypothetical protein